MLFRSTKSDLVDAAAIDALKETIHATNQIADIRVVLMGEIEPSELTNLGLASARGNTATLQFLGAPLDAAAGAGEGYLGTRVGLAKGKLGTLHDPSINTLSLRFDTPFTWEGFSAALELLTTLRGPDMLRIKGIVNVAGKPVVVQGVQHIFHPPVELDRWPSADTGTRLVFITRNITAEAIRGLFAAVGAVAGVGFQDSKVIFQ